VVFLGKLVAEYRKDFFKEITIDNKRIYCFDSLIFLDHPVCSIMYASKFTTNRR